MSNFRQNIQGKADIIGGRAGSGFFRLAAPFFESMRRREAAELTLRAMADFPEDFDISAKKAEGFENLRFHAEHAADEKRGKWERLKERLTPQAAEGRPWPGPLKDFDFEQIVRTGYTTPCPDADGHGNVIETCFEQAFACGKIQSPEDTLAAMGRIGEAAADVLDGYGSGGLAWQSGCRAMVPDMIFASRGLAAAEPFMGPFFDALREHDKAREFIQESLRDLSERADNYEGHWPRPGRRELEGFGRTLKYAEERSAADALALERARAATRPGGPGSREPIPDYVGPQEEGPEGPEAESELE